MLSVLVISQLLALQATGATPPPAPTRDPRIDASRITRIDALDGEASFARTDPPRPVLRIAENAAAVPMDPAVYEKARAAIARGLAALASMQSKEGAFFVDREVAPTDMEPRKRASSIAVTALALKAFEQAPSAASHEARAKARAMVLSSLLDPAERTRIEQGGVGNYVMSAVASGLAAAGDADAQAGVETALAWVRSNQWDQGEGIDPREDWFGGAGYGNGKRPDLSNTQMMVDAMHDAGVSPDDPAMQRALAFVARAQNRKASNGAAWAQSGANDGGFVYSPANGGESFASDAAGEGRYGEKLATKSLRSYGSMTYAGFKSMLYAGLSKEDPRVQDALAWIGAHFTFEENPGLGQQGYFYYIHAMSRALHASGLERIVDSTGTERDWRAELVEALVRRQSEAGTWRNSHERWEESREDLATIYAVLALEEAIKSPARKVVTPAR